MVYLNNKNLKEKYSLEFGFKHRFISSVFWENSVFSFDTKLTLNLSGGGRWDVYLFSSGPIRYSVT